PGGWSGGDTGSDGVSCIEVAGSQLPIDQDISINDLPSLRLNIIKDGSWWISLLAGPGWNTYNLESYYENGVLEFNIKGARGGENFSLGFFDKVPDRNPIEKGTSYPLSNFAAVTQEWQRISIPLKDLIDPESGYKLTSTTYIRFEKNWGAPEQIFKVWLSDISVTSPDNEKSFAAIKVNQVGYTTKAEKYALVSGFEGTVSLSEATCFEVKKADTGKTVYSGTLKKVTDLDEKVSGEMVYTACFTQLKKPGNYYISVNADNVPDSYTFTIGNDIFDNLIVDASRYFYFQRANMALEPEYAGEFARNDFTPGDFSAPLKSDPNGERRDVSGGWYDAGDFGKYTNAGAMAISDLLWAYELYPREFTDGQFTIPESGNGIPDILDEARYEAEFFLKLQDTDGGFFHRVYPGTKETEPDTRYIDDVLGSQTHIKPTSHSGAATGVLAHAALVYAPVDAVFSARMLAAAIKGWEYLEAHPVLVPSLQGAYNDDNDEDERFYAAAALFKATGEAKYNDYVKAHYKEYTNMFINPQNAHSWGSFELTGFFHYAGSDSPDPEVYGWFKEKFANWRAIQLSRGYNNPWRNTLREYDYYWGSNLPVLCTSMDLIIGSKLLGTYNSQVVNVARSNLNYVLGINPMAFSYVSGYGENSLTEVFSGIYSEDEIPYIPDGYLAGGANMYQGSWFSRFNGKCYNDVNTEWTTNEHTIYWNSGLVFSAAFAAAEAKARSGDIKTMIIYPEEWIIDAGETTEVNIAALFNGCNIDIIKGADVVYEVLRPEIASVTPEGVITGLKPGIAFIKADITYGNYSENRKFFVLVK
ncbi:MAG: glycoside hydrolase family 9 protein, partial [Spirochaetales bacterium]|nr:glycoside hydrolase family 9 protein [Spirochaetales bacterium]